jgi:hypothetical protein
MKLMGPTLLAALLLAGCNSAAPPPPAAEPGSVTVTPPGFQLPEGGSCEGDIARYRAIQDNDLSMGHVAQSVYNQIKREIAAAEEECAKGHEAAGRAAIVASRRKHGYPTDL